MDSEYKLILTEEWFDSVESCVGYILNEFGNRLAAERLMDDVENALDLLKYTAGGHSFCEGRKLYAAGVRKIHLKKYNYKILYAIIENDIVKVISLVHDKQDYQKVISG